MEEEEEEEEEDAKESNGRDGDATADVVPTNDRRVGEEKSLSRVCRGPPADLVM